MRKKQQNLYVCRKHIFASSALDAIKKDKLTPVHEVWLDEDWKKKSLESAIGFHQTQIPDEE